MIDFLVSLAALLLISPIFLIVMIALLVANKGKPFFFQRRPGKNERVFTIVKFRSMTERKDEFGNLLPDGERLTKIGRLVRNASIDEIPQLLNVLKGDMSLVGPRPLLIQYLPLYNAQQRTRHNIRPGITGLAQVMGRNAIGWKEKLEYDVYYVNNISFLGDLKILLRTFKKVFYRDGIAQEGHATMEYFTGNKK